MFMKAKGTIPGPGITKARGRASQLIATGRSLPPAGALGDMAARLPRHFWQTPSFKKWRKRVILFVVALIVVLGIFLGWKFYANISRLFGGNFFGLFNSTQLRGEDSGHVNILIAGYSADDPGHDGAKLTDSIMVASINTKNHTAFLLSIPRDLWVDLPNGGQGKINEVFEDGLSAGGSTKSGMSDLKQVVSQDFGLPLDYWALVNYAAIKDAVNAVGGIDVHIKSCDPRGLYDPNIDWSTGGPLVDLSNGWHHLNGRKALDLARARGDPSIHGQPYGYCQSDYERASYQRQMLIALKDKATSAGTLTNPFRLADLLDAVGANVKTDFSTSEIHRLYDIVKPISKNNVKSYGLNDVDGNGKALVVGDMIYGQSVQVPEAGAGNYTEIQQFVQKLLSTGVQSTSKH